MANLIPPPHPGETLREDVLDPLGMSVNQLAKALGITATRLNDVVRGRRGITADTALRLARYLGPPLNSGSVSNSNTISARRASRGNEKSRKWCGPGRRLRLSAIDGRFTHLILRGAARVQAMVSVTPPAIRAHALSVALRRANSLKLLNLA